VDGPDGATLWTGLLPGEVSNGPAVAPPAISDGPTPAGVMAFPAAGCGAATCDPTWTFELGSAVPPVVAAPGGDDVFTIRDDSLLVSLSRVEGSAPGLALANDRIYVVGGATVRRIWLNSSVGPTAALPAAATAAPVVAGDLVYVPHPGGGLDVHARPPAAGDRACGGGDRSPHCGRRARAGRPPSNGGWVRSAVRLHPAKLSPPG
jgi:hypothetical protein